MQISTKDAAKFRSLMQQYQTEKAKYEEEQRIWRAERGKRIARDISVTCVIALIIFTVYYYRYGNGYLMQQIKAGNLEAVKTFVQAGACDTGSSVLLEYARKGDIDKVSLLLKAGVKVDLSPELRDKLKNELLSAERNGKRDIVVSLLAIGVKVDADSISNLHDLYDQATSGQAKEQIANLIRSRGAILAPTREQIISAARKYGFTVVDDKNTYKKDPKGFSDKILAQEESYKGVVYFCVHNVCWEKGYIIFAPSTFYHSRYSRWRNDPQINRSDIRSALSSELSGSLLDRAVDALWELCN